MNRKSCKMMSKMIRHFGHRTALIAHWSVWELLIAKHLHYWCQNVYVARSPAGTFKGKLKTWQAWGFWAGKLIICHAWELDPWLNSLSKPIVYLHRQQCLPIEDFQAFQVLRTWSAWQFESFKAIKLHLQNVSSFVCPPLGEYRPEVQKWKSSQSCMRCIKNLLW